MRNALVLLFASALIFSACRKLDVPDPAFDGIFTDWEWVKTTGGFGGQVITPNTSFRTVTLILKERGRWRIKSSNEDESYRERFDFDGDSYQSGGYPAVRIKFNDKNILPLELKIKGDTLITSQVDVADGYTFYYIKKN